MTTLSAVHIATEIPTDMSETALKWALSKFDGGASAYQIIVPPEDLYETLRIVEEFPLLTFNILCAPTAVLAKDKWMVTAYGQPYVVYTN